MAGADVRCMAYKITQCGTKGEFAAAARMVAKKMLLRNLPALCSCLFEGILLQ